MKPRHWPLLPILLSRKGAMYLVADCAVRRHRMYDVHTITCPLEDVTFARCYWKVSYTHIHAREK